MRTTLARAINAGLAQAMADDDKVLLYGEDIGRLGGVFRVTEKLQERFGADRVIDSPLAESGLVGTSIGLAMRGYRPVVEIQFDGFVFPAFDQIVTQLAKMHFRTHGRQAMPVVVRMPCGGGIGSIEHHSESPESYFAHTAGLRVLCPASPQDAYWMIQQAIRSDDPVVFLEPKRRYHDKGELDEQAPAPAMDLARIARPGTDATLVAYGPQVKTCLEAAEVAAGEGHDLEVVDLRSLSPIDFDTIRESALRTRHVVVVHEAQRTLGLGAEIAARLQQELYYDLAAPVLRVTGFDTPYPPSRSEAEWLPGLDRILAAVDDSLAHV